MDTSDGSHIFPNSHGDETGPATEMVIDAVAQGTSG